VRKYERDVNSDVSYFVLNLILGINEDGNILDPANVESFVHYVKENTDGRGVHLMMADGVSCEPQTIFFEITKFLLI
jgi:hypothetical protein